ncbi:hypothetical protein [Brackiella oedipodis]|uniref:transglycosylase SLT domain-containing protein n=1 Tax=Brackiella oedipodis TaxID=124225 RepID=UPI000A6833E3|nr:hypothetical protein [Brackiella oedipodis]
MGGTGLVTKWHKHLWIYGLVSLAALSGCSTTPPSHPDNICEIFTEKPKWHRYAEASRAKWGVPPQILMAILFQESSFKHDALPPKDHILWVIPWGRVSSAKGYPQAKDEVWEEYQQAVGHSASRSDMEDSLDFMGWYLDKAQQLNGVSKWDTYNLYLNYHEGWGGFKRGTYHSKAWLKKTATIVKDRADTYGAQYFACRDHL